MDGGGFTYTWQSLHLHQLSDTAKEEGETDRYDNMRNVPVFCYNFETFYGIAVTDDIGQ
jgi:hypothetical protein